MSILRRPSAGFAMLVALVGCDTNNKLPRRAAVPACRQAQQLLTALRGYRSSDGAQRWAWIDGVVHAQLSTYMATQHTLPGPKAADKFIVTAVSRLAPVPGS